MTTNTHILWRHPKRQTLLEAPCSETFIPGTETLFPLRGKDRILGIEKCLPKKSLLQLVGDHKGETISCSKGVIWITQTGDPEDILLCAGEAFTITKKGTILIEGLVDTSLKIASFGMKKQGLTQTLGS